MSVRIVIVVTAETTARHFVTGYADYLASCGYAVTVVASSAASVVRRWGTPVDWVAVPMERSPHPLRDARSLVRLVRLLRRVRPDAIVYATPKASLLASIAGAVTRVPVRIYELWGLRLETAHGFGRAVLSALERLTSRLSTVILPNSRSLLARYEHLDLPCGTPLQMLGEGSSHGINIERFSADADITRADAETQRWLDEDPSVTVVGFVGRLHPDKGVDTLLDALRACSARGTAVRALIVGRDEGAGLGGATGELAGEVSVHLTGSVADPRPYFAAMDILVLPSLREGFPNVVLEAASMGLPSVVSDGTGVVDSVVHGATGLVCPVGDADAFADAISVLASDPARREQYGKAARARVERSFRQDHVWGLYESHLRQSLAEVG